LLCDLLFNLI